ncbi:hypothetical protein JXA34_01030 [Patescibacteria group bacterium]|nr:hypothetical protein [Patescibacteria group bacterium]
MFNKDVLKKIDKETVVSVLIMIAFSLVPLIWFRGNYLIGFGDVHKSIDFVTFLKTLKNPWDGYRNTGFYNFNMAVLFPSSIIMFPLYWLGFSSLNIEKIWMVVSTFFPMFFMFLFLSEYWENKTSKYVSAAVSIFYVYNPLTMLSPINLATSKYPVFLTLPLACYLVFRIFNSTLWVRKIRLGILLAVSSILISGSISNPAELAPFVVIVTTFLVYNLLVTKEKIKHAVLISGVLVLTTAVCMWVLSSTFYNQFMRRDVFTGQLETFSAGGTYIFDALRLFGFWALNHSFGPVPYYSYAAHFYSLSGILSTYLIPVLVFIPLFLLHHKRKDKLKLLVSMGLVFIGLFLVKGSNSPFGAWYKMMFDRFSVFKVFREPYAKFSLISLFSYAVAITYTLFFLNEKLKGKIKHSVEILSIAFLVLTVSIAYPLFNGDLLSDFTFGRIKQSRVIVPDYWKELRKYTEEVEIEDRILTMPHTWYYAKSFIWPSGYVGRPYEIFVDGNTISRRETNPLTHGDELINTMYNAVNHYNESHEEKYFNIFVNLAQILDVSHILQMNDFDRLNYEDETFMFHLWGRDEMDRFYSELSSHYEKIKSFGFLTPEYLMSIPHILGGPNIYRVEGTATTEDYMSEYSNQETLQLYKIKDEKSLGKIYSPNYIVKTGNRDNLIALLASKDFTGLKPLYLEETIEDAFEDQNIEIDYQKISDSRYKLDIRNMPKNPFFVIFNESFDAGWKIGEKCGFFGCSKTHSSTHFISNHYGNGWVLYPKETQTELYIVHDSEYRFKIGVIISFLALFSCLLLYIKADKVALSLPKGVKNKKK